VHIRRTISQDIVVCLTREGFENHFHTVYFTGGEEGISSRSNVSFPDYRNRYFIASGSPVLLVFAMPCSTQAAMCTCLTEASLLVLDGDVRTSSALVRRANVVADLLVLGLLDSGLYNVSPRTTSHSNVTTYLVVLRTGAHELLLHHVDTCELSVT
jgi:hypothetical protein